MKRVGHVDDEYVNTLWRVKETNLEIGCFAGSIYLVYDQKGWGLDFVRISDEIPSPPLMRVLERDLHKRLDKVNPRSIHVLLEAWINSRAEVLKTVSDVNAEDLLKILNDEPSEERYQVVLSALVTFQIRFEALERQIELMNEFPNLRIDIDRPVRRKVANEGPASGEKVGEVLTVTPSDTGYIAWVMWEDESQEDIDANDIENVPE